jgi:hypothetical protein
MQFRIKHLFIVTAILAVFAITLVPVPQPTTERLLETHSEEFEQIVAMVDDDKELQVFFNASHLDNEAITLERGIEYGNLLSDAGFPGAWFKCERDGIKLKSLEIWLDEPVGDEPLTTIVYSTETPTLDGKQETGFRGLKRSYKAVMKNWYLVVHGNN